MNAEHREERRWVLLICPECSCNMSSPTRHARGCSNTWEGLEDSIQIEVIPADRERVLVEREQEYLTTIREMDAEHHRAWDRLYAENERLRGALRSTPPEETEGTMNTKMLPVLIGGPDAGKPIDEPRPAVYERRAIGLNLGQLPRDHPAAPPVVEYWAAHWLSEREAEILAWEEIVRRACG